MDDIRPVGNRRKAKLESFLKREIATVVTGELRDPRIGFITITRCELATDNSEITAYYTLLDPQRQGLAQRALDRARHFVQRQYAKHIRMRRLPLLQFRYDDEERKRQDMDDLIREARLSDPDSEAEPPATDTPPAG